MNMVRNILRLWKNRNEYKSTTLQHRLILFFFLVICSIILLFTMLLMIFGITGNEKTSVQSYLNGELSYISTAIEEDFGHISATGIRLAETLSEKGDKFFDKNNIKASDISENSEITDELLSAQINELTSVADNNTCGGVFVILDSSSAKTTDKKSGFFLKKTQPVSSAALTSESYFLRGPASVARENSIKLIGQWQMQFDKSELDFFQTVVSTAKENPELPLSKLYYWSDRICLNGNSESGLLLCVPLRSDDGTVWGICGIEVSDRMFKKLYSPKENVLQGLFAAAAPISDETLFSNRGLIAGNAYLTDRQLSEQFTYQKGKYGFPVFRSSGQSYCGLNSSIRLYSGSSPYADEQWAVVTMMPEDLLNSAVKGNSTYLIFIVTGLMIVSLAASAIVSQKYLQPIKQKLSSLREESPDAFSYDSGIVEIDCFFEDIAEKIRKHQEELERISLEKKNAEDKYAKAQTQLRRLTENQKYELDTDTCELLAKNLKTLTAAEHNVLNLYLTGKTTNEITEILQIKLNTLKYHNKNIYAKLGVNSRKQLFMYADILNQEMNK